MASQECITVNVYTVQFDSLRLLWSYLTTYLVPPMKGKTNLPLSSPNHLTSFFFGLYTYVCKPKIRTLCTLVLKFVYLIVVVLKYLPTSVQSFSGTTFKLSRSGNATPSLNLETHHLRFIRSNITLHQMRHG